MEHGVARRVDTADATAETLRTARDDLVTDPERIARTRQLQAAGRWPLAAPRAEPHAPPTSSRTR